MCALAFVDAEADSWDGLSEPYVAVCGACVSLHFKAVLKSDISNLLCESGIIKISCAWSVAEELNFNADAVVLECYP